MSVATNGRGGYGSYGKKLKEFRHSLYLSSEMSTDLIGEYCAFLTQFRTACLSREPEMLKRFAHEFDIECNRIGTDRPLQACGCSLPQHLRKSNKSFLPVDTFNGDDGKEVLHEIGGLFRGIRKQKGLSLKEVSKEIGVNLSHLSRFETGQRKWGVALLEDLVQALDPSLELASIFGIVGITEAEYERIKLKQVTLNTNLR